jgi:hypothetical protein
MTFDELSDQIMGPVLDSMPPTEQRKLLLVIRKLSHPRAYGWIDRELKARKLLKTESSRASDF